jgi:hypothetical protein
MVIDVNVSLLISTKFRLMSFSWELIDARKGSISLSIDGLNFAFMKSIKATNIFKLW